MHLCMHCPDTPMRCPDENQIFVIALTCLALHQQNHSDPPITQSCSSVPWLYLFSSSHFTTPTNHKTSKWQMQCQAMLHVWHYGSQSMVKFPSQIMSIMNAVVDYQIIPKIWIWEWAKSNALADSMLVQILNCTKRAERGLKLKWSYQLKERLDQSKAMQLATDKCMQDDQTCRSRLMNGGLLILPFADARGSKSSFFAIDAIHVEKTWNLEQGISSVAFEAL